MSLADQIATMEEDLALAQRDLRSAENEVDELRSYATDLEAELKEANAFIDYVDKAHPELRTAFDVAEKLEDK